MTPKVIAAALGGHRSGTAWMACCPAHDDSTPSLSIKQTGEGRLLVHCFAGCPGAAVVAALKSRGLWPDPGASINADAAAPTNACQRPAGDEKARTAAALRIWCNARPAIGTLVEIYLRSRGITVPVPSSIKFYHALKHRSGCAWPAMVALVTEGGANRPTAVQRTWLKHDGTGKAPVEPDKMMLGPCRGGAVRLAPASVPLLIGEGIETSLSAMQATRHSAWAALSTSGLRQLELPRDISEIVLLADGDEPGATAAEFAARRWSREGRRVRIAQAPTGTDFNDLLIGRVPPHQEAD